MKIRYRPMLFIDSDITTHHVYIYAFRCVQVDFYRWIDCSGWLGCVDGLADKVPRLAGCRFRWPKRYLCICV